MSQQDLEQMQGAQPAAPAPAVEAPVAQPTERVIDPNYVAQLEQYARQQQAELNRYEAVKEDVAWMLEDESRLKGIRRYKKAYTDAATPQVDPTLAPVMEYVKSELAPVREYVDEQRKTAQQRAQVERQSYEAENLRYLSKITAEHKLSPEQQMKLAGYADAAAQRLGRNVPIEEAWKDFSGGWGQTKTAEATAPVQRADSAEIGVPGPSAPDSKRWVTDFHGALSDALRAEKRTA